MIKGQELKFALELIWNADKLQNSAYINRWVISHSTGLTCKPGRLVTAPSASKDFMRRVRREYNKRKSP